MRCAFCGGGRGVRTRRLTPSATLELCKECHDLLKLAVEKRRSKKS